MERLGGGVNGAVNVRVGMSGGNKGNLELRGRKVDALIEETAEECAEPLQIGCPGRFEVGNFMIGKEHGDHGAHSIHANRNAGSSSAFKEPALEPLPELFKASERIFLPKPPQR